MNEFLKNLKESLESGDCHSEAAKKIMDISELSEKKSVSEVEKKVSKIQKEPFSGDINGEKLLPYNPFDSSVYDEKTEFYKALADIENYEKELNESFFKFKEYCDLIRLRLSNLDKENNELLTELFTKVSSPIDLDRILSKRIMDDARLYLDNLDDKATVTEN